MYIHTTKNQLIEVNSNIRIPRTYKRFAGLMGSNEGKRSSRSPVVAQGEGETHRKRRHAHESSPPERGIRSPSRQQTIWFRLADAVTHSHLGHGSAGGSSRIRSSTEQRG